MILKSLKLFNFRGYRDIEIPFSPNLNIIIGRNDVGKSTILEALDIFFDNGIIPVELSDLNMSANKEGDKTMSIEASFEIEPQKTYLIDANKWILLKDEYLTNGENTLTIKKEWDCSGSKLTASSLKMSIIARCLKAYKENPLVCEKLSS